MKKKNYFILMGAFIVSALHCSNDRDDLINIHSQSVDFDSEINTKIATFHDFPEEEKEKVRLSLLGVDYIGFIGDYMVYLNIKSDGSLEITTKNTGTLGDPNAPENLYYNYTVSFDGKPSLILDKDGGIFYIIFSDTEITDVVGFYGSIGPFFRIS